MDSGITNATPWSTGSADPHSGLDWSKSKQISSAEPVDCRQLLELIGLLRPTVQKLGGQQSPES
jgi:hypothetical protein